MPKNLAVHMGEIGQQPQVWIKFIWGLKMFKPYS